jgi:Cu/Ag efflux pump CusA
MVSAIGIKAMAAAATHRLYRSVSRKAITSSHLMTATLVLSFRSFRLAALIGSVAVLHSTRHVLATTLTTVIGFLPLMLDPTGFWPPLAIAVSGGLVGATALALFYVPAAHSLLMRKTARGPVATQGPVAAGVMATAIAPPQC